MGFYDITDSRTGHNGEHLYLSACYSEANWLKGSRVTFYPCKNYNRDLESDFHATLGEPVEINIVLEEYSESELEKKNLIVEDDTIPYNARISNIIWPRFVSYRRECQKRGLSPKEVFNSTYNENGIIVVDADFYIRVSKFAIVEFPYTMEVQGTQKFRITTVKGDQHNPFIWNCRLAPHREQYDLIPSTKYVDNLNNYDKGRYQVGYTFLNKPNVRFDDRKIPVHPRDVNDSPVKLEDIPPEDLGLSPVPPIPPEDLDDPFEPDVQSPEDFPSPEPPFEEDTGNAGSTAPKPPDAPGGEETPNPPTDTDADVPTPPGGLELPEDIIPFSVDDTRKYTDISEVSEPPKDAEPTSLPKTRKTKKLDTGMLR